jgi:PAS domain S-box-containing protein
MAQTTLNKFNLKLAHKGLAVLGLSVLFQLVLFGALAALHTQAEQEALKAYRSSRISETVNGVIRDIFDMASLSPGEVSIFADSGFETYAVNIRDDLNNLKEAVKGDPAKMEIVARSTKAGEDAYYILERLHRIYVDEGPISALDELNSFRPQLRLCTKQIVSRDLISMARTEEKGAARSPEIQAKFRDQIRLLLIVNLLLGVAVTGVMATLFYRQIVKRLATIIDNSYRLASRRPLNAPLGGVDEVSEIDQAFHQMASSLTEAEQREKDLLEHSVDVICSLDPLGKFVDVNPASKQVLEYPEDQLIGQNVRNILVGDDIEHFKKSLSTVMTRTGEAKFEARVMSPRGKSIDLDWSVRWVPNKRLFFCVGHDISQRKELERMKQEFMAMISHDLRTPLMTIGNYFEMLESGMFGELTDKGQHLLKVAERNSNRMLTLVSDLLDLEKSESGQLKLNRSTLDISELTEQAVNSLSSLAARQEVQLTMSPSELTVFADPHRVSQVLVNLISNAIKFSPKNSNIHISAERQGTMALVHVSDQGRGVPEHLKEAIFDRFQQVEIADTVDKGGSGLGLAICKTIVELHGGTIKVENNGGPGSTFTFSLPLAENG